MREWRNKLGNEQWGASENITFAYKHVSYYGMHKRAARYVGLPRAEGTIYVRISRPEHVKTKQDRYYRYGFLTNMIVSCIEIILFPRLQSIHHRLFFWQTFGIILGLSGIALIGTIIVFACSDS